MHLWRLLGLGSSTLLLDLPAGQADVLGRSANIKLADVSSFLKTPGDISRQKAAEAAAAGVPADLHLGVPQDRAWTNSRVRAIAASTREVLELFRNGLEDFGDPPSEEEVEQALHWASYPQPITDVKTLVYANKAHSNLALLKATAPFPLTVVSLPGEWKGTVDKLAGFWSYLQYVDDRDIVVLCDAFDVFATNFDGHELLRRYFSFKRPIVIATEENVFPREVGDQGELAIMAMSELGHVDGSQPSRFLNAGGIIGVAWAMKKMYNNMRTFMAANDPVNLQRYSNVAGHWFLHAYDQYELWSYFIRHSGEVYRDNAEVLIALDTEQLIFGSTVMRKENWPVLLRDVEPANHSIDVDFPLVFDAPQSLFEIKSCRARFVGRRHFPVFWHGHGPLKGAWLGLRDRLDKLGCFPAAASATLVSNRVIMDENFQP